MRLQGITDEALTRIASTLPKKQAQSAETPQVYVGTYAKYNSGNLDGAWLDLEDYADLEDFYEAAGELHKDEADPEFMFQDWSGIPDGMIGESWISPSIFDYIEAAKYWDEDDREAFKTFMEYEWTEGEEKLSEALQAFEEAYVGQFDSVGDYAAQYIDDIGGVNELSPEIREFHFDREGFERDLGFEGWYEENGMVYDPSGEEYGEGTIEEVVDGWLDEGIIGEETFSRYFDYDSFGRDLDLGGDISFVNGFVFRPYY
jgi:antirestriction protein